MRDYPVGVRSIQEIRRANFLLLLEEAGSAIELHRATGVPQPFISQIKNRVKLESGGERKIGDDTAHKLERGMGKPTGWMDLDQNLWPFTTISLAKIQALSDKSLAHLEAAIVISAAQLGIDISATPRFTGEPPIEGLSEFPMTRNRERSTITPPAQQKRTALEEAIAAGQGDATNGKRSALKRVQADRRGKRA